MKPSFLTDVKQEMPDWVARVYAYQVADGSHALYEQLVDELIPRLRLELRQPSSLPNPAKRLRLFPCGDVDSDLVIDEDDVEDIRDRLADPTGAPLSAGELARCSVIGGPLDCDIRDVAVLIRHNAAMPPGISPVCDAMPGP